jgi:iron complex outermembrane recepter protein
MHIKNIVPKLDASDCTLAVMISLKQGILDLRRRRGLSAVTVAQPRLPKVIIGAVSLLAIAATPSHAESVTNNASDSATLEEIEVTADRKDSWSADLVQVGSFRGARQLDTPLTIDVIPDALIQSQQDQSLFDALRNTAGVSPAQTSTTVYSNIAIRGINVENRGNYRLDGVLPIINLIDLPLEDKDRVEVLKGASALYYGFTAPAGIVNLTMKRPTPDPYIAGTLFGNEYGELGGHIDAANTWGPLGVRINALYGSVDPGIEHTRGHRSLLAAALDLKPTDGLTLSLDAEHIFKLVNEPGVFRYLKFPKPTPENLYPPLLLPPLLNPTVNFGPDWASNRAEETNLLAIASWKISPAWLLSVSYGSSHLVRDRHFSSIDLLTYGPDTNGDGLLSIGQQPGQTYDNSNYRGEIAGALNLWFMKHQVLLGASQNVRDAFNSTNVPATCPGVTSTAPRVTCTQNVFNPVDIPVTAFPAPTGTRARINDIGYYLFDRIEMAEWLELLLGVRKADYTETDLDTHAVTFHATPTSLSYGAVVKPWQWMSLYGSYIEGLESTPSAPITATNSGATLPPSDSTQREAGIKVEVQPGLLLHAAYFNIEQASAFVNGANVYVLDGRARYRGAEFGVAGEITRDLSVYATGQILDAKQISGADTLITTNPKTGVVTVVPTVVGLKIENTPERTLSLACEYRTSNLLPGFSANGAIYYVSERAVNQFNQAFIPGYTLFDLGAAYAATFYGQETTVRVTGQNIADKRYFSSTGASIVAQGPPRVLRFSVTVRF